jgi:hypothetical protein
VKNRKPKRNNSRCHKGQDEGDVSAISGFPKKGKHFKQFKFGAFPAMVRHGNAWHSPEKEVRLYENSIGRRLIRGL